MPFSTHAPAPPAPATSEVRVAGIGVAPGVAIGPAYLYAGGGLQAEKEHLSPELVEGELARFERAIERSERELRKVVTVAQEKLGDDSARIFDAQLLILRDSAFYDATRALVQERQMGAGWAAQTVLAEHRRRLEASPSAHLRERAADFVDVQNRVLRNLQQGRALSRIDEDHVVVAENLSAADILLFSRRGVLGCVLDFGGPTSHVSIMARALGVPAVVSLHGLSASVEAGDLVICDGFSGTVVVRPAPETLAHYEAKRDRFARLRETQEAVAAAPSETLDGKKIALQANVEFREEFPLLHAFGAEGIGLFRTELLFLTQGRSLDEDEQFVVYRDALRAAAPHPVTFRLLDLGGDKVLPMARREPNPWLGWRGLRILLDKPDLLRPQLRAILRAAAEGDRDGLGLDGVDGQASPPPCRARILLPMVSALTEVHAFKRALRAVCDELADEGLPFRSDVPVGIMVEVPAVALLAERFAAHVDFFSIGTNDLTQFTLAVDRGNDLVASLYQELHPAVLGLIAQTVRAAKAAGLPVSVCGELAADPRATPLLVGLGVDTLSVSPAYLTLVKRVLRALSCEEAEGLAARALRQADAASVRRLLDHFLACHNRDLADLLGPDPLPPIPPAHV